MSGVILYPASVTNVAGVVSRLGGSLPSSAESPGLANLFGRLILTPADRNPFDVVGVEVEMSVSYKKRRQNI